MNFLKHPVKYKQVKAILKKAAMLIAAYSQWPKGEAPSALLDEQHGHTMERYAALQRKGVLTPATMWVNLKAIVLSEYASHKNTNTV